MASLVLGTVHPDMIDAQFVYCVVSTLTEDYHGRFPVRGRVLFERAPAGMIHVARNAVVQRFLSHPLQPSHLLFVDTDIAWRPEDVWALCETAEAGEHLIVGGLVSYNQPGEDGAGVSVPMLYDEDIQPMAVREDVQRVFCGGLGFMLIHRTALDAVGRASGWPAPWFDYGQRRGRNVSEDIVFAQRCADLAIPVHVDTRIRVGHRKTFAYRHPVEASCLAY